MSKKPKPPRHPFPVVLLNHVKLPNRRDGFRWRCPICEVVNHERWVKIPKSEESATLNALAGAMKLDDGGQYAPPTEATCGKCDTTFRTRH